MNHVILLHGALGASSQLDPLKKLISDLERTVWSMDFSGHHGKAFSAKGFGIGAFADDVLSFMDNNGIDKADFFGYSMGGYVAMWLAYINPKRVGKIVTLGTKFDWSIASAEKEIMKMDPEKILLKVPAFARILETRHKPNDWKELMRKTADMMRSLGEAPLLTDGAFAAIQPSVVVCLGDKDDMADRQYSQHVADLVPNGQFILLENTTHPIEALDLGSFMKVWSAAE